MDRSINQSTKSINQSIHGINQSTNQSINPSINKSINQSIRSTPMISCEYSISSKKLQIPCPNYDQIPAGEQLGVLPLNPSSFFHPKIGTRQGETYRIEWVTPGVMRMASWREVPVWRRECPRTKAPSPYESLVTRVTKASAKEEETENFGRRATGDGRWADMFWMARDSFTILTWRHFFPLVGGIVSDGAE